MKESGNDSSNSIDSLGYERSKQLAIAINKNEYAHLIKCKRDKSTDFITFQVDVELPQRPPVPINQIEDILIKVKDENDIPDVFALREDFPETIHQNLVSLGSPAWLCLYEDPWVDISDTITPELFIERIREWLKRAAINELHLHDQPLEPYLITKEKIIISEDILQNGVPKGHILLGTT